MYRIGIDLGGTNTAAGLVDTQGRIVDRASVKTNLPTDPQRIVNDMVHLTNLLLERNGLQKKDIAIVGVGVPCTANVRKGWMQDADHLGFSGAPLVEPLEEALGLPVAICNDADAAALGEYRGGGYGGNSFVLVTLGTGIGGGIMGRSLYKKMDLKAVNILYICLMVVIVSISIYNCIKYLNL